jgi:hypothetical protein
LQVEKRSNRLAHGQRRCSAYRSPHRLLSWQWGNRSWKVEPETADRAAYRIWDRNRFAYLRLPGALGM